MTEECQESYAECMAARRARVEAVIAAAEPWETEQQLAEKAGVSQKTINSYKKEEGIKCNKSSRRSADPLATARAAVMALDADELIAFKPWFNKWFRSYSGEQK